MEQVVGTLVLSHHHRLVGCRLDGVCYNRRCMCEQMKWAYRLRSYYDNVAALLRSGGWISSGWISSGLIAGLRRWITLLIVGGRVAGLLVGHSTQNAMRRQRSS